MKVFFEDGNGATEEIKEMNGMQTRQAVAIMDRIAGYIPIEGKDYDISITFHKNAPSVGVKITPYNRKGEVWRDLVSEMLNSGQ